MVGKAINYAECKELDIHIEKWIKLEEKYPEN